MIHSIQTSLAALLLVGFFTYAPARAQDADTQSGNVFAQSGDWTIVQFDDANFCRLRHAAGSPSAPTIAKAGVQPGFLQYRSPESGNAALGRDVEFDFDGVTFRGVMFADDIYAPLEATEAIETEFKRAQYMVVRHGGETIARLSLKGSSAAFAQLEKCALQWPNGRVPVVPPPPPRFPARPMVSEPDLSGPFPSNRALRPIDPGNWIFEWDFPSEALRLGQEGRVAFVLLVNRDGKVENCTVEASSGVPVLDEATCSVLGKYARFQPATDDQGNRIESRYRSAVAWQMPE